MNATMTGTSATTAVGVFHGYAEARRAVDALRRAGVRDDQIGVLGPGDATPPAERSGLASDPTGTRWEEGTGVGAAVGGAAGLGLRALVAAGLMSPVGPVIAGGTLVALLASAGAGATVGTVIGGLVGLGVPEDDAQWFAAETEAGRVVVTVRGADARTARDVLRENGATGRGASGVGYYGGM